MFVGGVSPAGGDLYAVAALGGEVTPLTYSNVGEMRPALSPDGGAVAFLRGGSLRDSMPASVWVMNLINGGERRIELPKDAGAPSRVAWSGDGRSLVMETAGGLYRATAPPTDTPARAVPPEGRAQAESSLAVLLGSPAFARVVPCAEPEDLCVAGDSGGPALLAPGAAHAARWGPDSVAYLSGGRLLVRPLGPGRARRVEWSRAPKAPRQITVFPGAPSR